MRNQNMMNLLAQYRSKFPQVFDTFNNFKNGNADPMGVLGQITSKFSPEQMKGFMQVAKNFGAPDELLNQIQNGINPKR